MNEYFTSISDIFNDHGTDALSSDLKELESFINHKVPDDVFFKIPFITPEQVSTFIAALDTSKATGLDCLGPRIIKKVGQVLSPSIAALINKSTQTGVFPDQLKCAKVFPIYKVVTNRILEITDLFRYYPPSQKFLKGILTNT